MKNRLSGKISLFLVIVCFILQIFSFSPIDPVMAGESDTFDLADVIGPVYDLENEEDYNTLSEKFRDTKLDICIDSYHKGIYTRVGREKKYYFSDVSDDHPIFNYPVVQGAGTHSFPRYLIDNICSLAPSGQVDAYSERFELAVKKYRLLHQLNMYTGKYMGDDEFNKINPGDKTFEELKKYCDGVCSLMPESEKAKIYGSDHSGVTRLGGVGANGEKGSGVMKMVLNALGAVLYFFGSSAKWILDLVHGGLDSIIMGRINSNGIIISSSGKEYYTSLFHFGLEQGNVYGTVGAAIYSVIRRYVMIIMSLIALFAYIRSMISFDASRGGILGEGGAMKALVGTLKNIIVCFAALMLMPIILDAVISLRDAAIYYLTGDIREALLGDGASQSIMDGVKPDGLGDGNLFGKSLVWLIVLGSVFTFLFNYLGYALHGVVLVAVFPFVCVRALLRGPHFFTDWVHSFVGILVYPLIDSILFLVPSAFLRLGKPVNGADAQLTFSIIAAILVYMIKPMRSVVFDVLALKESSLGDAAASAGGAVASIIGSASKVAFGEKKQGAKASAGGEEGGEGGKGEESGKSGEGNPAENATEAGAAVAGAAAGEAAGKGGTGTPQQNPVPSSPADFKTAFGKARAENHEKVTNDTEGKYKTNEARKRAQGKGAAFKTMAGDFIRNGGAQSVGGKLGRGAAAVMSSGLKTASAVAGAALGSATGHADWGANVGKGIAGSIGAGAARVGSAASGAMDMVNRYKQDAQAYSAMISKEEVDRAPGQHKELMENRYSVQGDASEGTRLKEGQNIVTIPYSPHTLGDATDFRQASSSLDAFGGDVAPSDAELVREVANNISENANHLDGYVRDVLGATEEPIEYIGDHGEKKEDFRYDVMENRDLVREQSVYESASGRINQDLFDDCRKHPEDYDSIEKLRAKIYEHHSVKGYTSAIRNTVADNMVKEGSPFITALDNSMIDAALLDKDPRKLLDNGGVKDRIANRQVVRHVADKFKKGGYVEDSVIERNIKYANDKKDKSGEPIYNAKDDFTSTVNVLASIRRDLSALSPDEVPEQFKFLLNK